MFAYNLCSAWLQNKKENETSSCEWDRRNKRRTGQGRKRSLKKREKEKKNNAKKRCYKEWKKRVVVKKNWNDKESNRNWESEKHKPRESQTPSPLTAARGLRNSAMMQMMTQAAISYRVPRSRLDLRSLVVCAVCCFDFRIIYCDFNEHLLLVCWMFPSYEPGWFG